MLPDDIRDFILRRLAAVAELEALLLLWRQPEQAWKTADLAKRLYISEVEVSRILGHLKAQALVAETEGAYRYGCTSQEETGRLVDRLAELYKTHLIPITNLMHSQPSSQIHEFAKAFILRKDK